MRLEALLGAERFAVLNRAVSGNGTVQLRNSHLVDAEDFSVEGALAFATMIAPAVAGACGSAQ